MKNATSKNIRLFKSDFMEALTHVHPITPLVFWAPVIIYFFYIGLRDGSFTNLELFLVVLFSFLIWTFTEYFMHRFIFHYKPTSNFGKRMIFLFHGIHHDDPNDKTRLVMPPVPAVLIVTVLYFLFKLVIPPVYLNIFMAVFLVGYLVYDYIHYATHHFPMKNRVGRFLKKWHLQHHHTKENVQYGVSNPLWDYVFGTVPQNRSRKLK